MREVGDALYNGVEIKKFKYRYKKKFCFDIVSKKRAEFCFVFLFFNAFFREFWIFKCLLFAVAGRRRWKADAGRVRNGKKHIRF